MRFLQMFARGIAVGAAVVGLGFFYGAWFTYFKRGLAGLHRMIEIRPGDTELYAKLIPITFAVGFALALILHAANWLDRRVRAWWARQWR